MLLNKQKVAFEQRPTCQADRDASINHVQVS
jgi:hypothetical protein